jgi:polar amino acid transport system substrate-binding protein
MNRMNRRSLLQRMGQLGGCFALGTSFPVLVTSCAGNVETSSNSPAPGQPATTQVPSTGLKVPGTLKWGADASGGAPFIFNDPKNPSQLVGFEVEIAAAIAKVMGIQQNHVQAGYPQLSAFLQANQFDMVLNGWEIDQEREKIQLFSEPYYRYGQQIVVRANDDRFKDLNETSEVTLATLAGMSVGTGLGYKAEQILKDDPKIKARAYDGNLPFDALKQKQLDAVMVDLPPVAYFVLGSGPGGSVDNALKLIGKPIFPNNYVIGFNKSNPKATALQSEINQALAIIKQDGTLKEIYQRWKMWNDEQAKIGIT